MLIVVWSLLGSHNFAMFNFEIISEVHYLGFEGDEVVDVRVAKNLVRILL